MRTHWKRLLMASLAVLAGMIASFLLFHFGEGGKYSEKAALGLGLFILAAACSTMAITFIVFSKLKAISDGRRYVLSFLFSCLSYAVLYFIAGMISGKLAEFAMWGLVFVLASIPIMFPLTAGCIFAVRLLSKKNKPVFPAPL